MKKILTMLFITIMLSGCNTAIKKESESKQTDNGIKYRIFEIEGMPCVWVERAIGYQGYAGMSCDWSKYKGD